MQEYWDQREQVSCLLDYWEIGLCVYWCKGGNRRRYFSVIRCMNHVGLGQHAKYPRHLCLISFYMACCLPTQLCFDEGFEHDQKRMAPWPLPRLAIPHTPMSFMSTLIHTTPRTMLSDPMTPPCSRMCCNLSVYICCWRVPLPTLH